MDNTMTNNMTGNSQRFFAYPSMNELKRKRRALIFNGLTWITIFFVFLREINPDVEEKLIVIYYIIDYAVFPLLKAFFTFLINLFNGVCTTLSSTVS